jgi:hypothetical protein
MFQLLRDFGTERTTQARMLCKLAETLEVLAETYGWFTEGFDSPDLQAAMAFLDA